MGNVKFKGYAIRTEKDKNGNPREIVMTRPVDDVKACRQCGKEPRQTHSSRCLKCSEGHKRQKVSDAILQQRIEKAKQKKND